MFLHGVDKYFWQIHINNISNREKKNFKQIHIKKYIFFPPQQIHLKKNLS